jgi:hypothetical protein
MAQTGLATFDTTLEKTNHVLKEIERAYGWPKERRNQAYDALRAVLHAVRDRLPVEETASWPLNYRCSCAASTTRAGTRAGCP